jgi:DSF synthase
MTNYGGNLGKGTFQTWVARRVVAIQLRALRSAFEPNPPCYDTISLTPDAIPGILWCNLELGDKPVVTHALIDDIIRMQADLKHRVAESRGGPNPIEYFVLASRTPGVFNLGGDLAYFVDSFRKGNRADLRSYARKCVDIIHANVHGMHLPITTFALVQGDALGGGFEMALSYDFIVAERGVKMGFPEIRFNLFPGMGAYSLLARRLDAVRAERMITSGRVYVADELHEMGLVDVLADKGQGESALRDTIERHRRKSNAHRAIHQARRLSRPLSKQELVDIVDLWVDAVFRLSDGDCRRMAHITSAQSRRLAPAEAANASAQPRSRA